MKTKVELNGYDAQGAAKLLAAIVEAEVGRPNRYDVHIPGAVVSVEIQPRLNQDEVQP